MEENALHDSGSPLTTQSIKTVKTLLAYMGQATDHLPTFLEIPGGRCILVLSSKPDVYYVVTQLS